MSPEVSFENSEFVWDQLGKISLRAEDKVLLQKSYRTRINKEDDIIEFQFKILPETVSKKEIIRAWFLATELAWSLSSLYGKPIYVMIRIKECCQKGCFGCTQFGK